MKLGLIMTPSELLEAVNEVNELRIELEAEQKRGDMHADINRRAAEALGKPLSGDGSSWHDIPECVEQLKAWKDAIQEYCIIDFVEMTEPTETLAKLIEWNVKMALDPAISKDANDLIEEHTGKLKEEREVLRSLIQFVMKCTEADEDGIYLDVSGNAARMIYEKLESALREG